MIPRYRHSGPDSWSSPRPHTDASHRYRAYGPIKPMRPEGQPSLLGGTLLLVALFVIGALAAAAIGGH